MRCALAVLVLVLMLATPAAAAPGPNHVDPRIADGSAARALARAQQRWIKAAIASYSFDAAITCFCPPTTPLHVVVVAGKPRKPYSRVSRVATVPRMFAVIRAAIRQRFSTLKVTYGRFGVPASIGLNPSAQVIDEETYYTIEHFRRR